MDVGYVIAALDFAVAILVVALMTVSARRLRGGTLAWVSYAVLVAGVLYAVHAGVEILGLGEDLYAVTALVATLVLSFAVVIVNITLTILGVRK